MIKDFKYIYKYYSRVLDLHHKPRSLYYDINNKITIYWPENEESVSIKRFINHTSVGKGDLDHNLTKVYFYLLKDHE